MKSFQDLSWNMLVKIAGVRATQNRESVTGAGQKECAVEKGMIGLEMDVTARLVDLVTYVFLSLEVIQNYADEFAGNIEQYIEVILQHNAMVE